MLCLAVIKGQVQGRVRECTLFCWIGGCSLGCACVCSRLSGDVVTSVSGYCVYPSCARPGLYENGCVLGATCPEVIYNIPHLVFRTRRRAPTVESVLPAGAFVIQDPNKQCSAGTILTTIAECSSVKTVLGPRAAAVTVEDYAKAPKGCSRTNGQWYFNTHTEGALDGTSEPVCKIIAGKPLLPHQTHMHAYARSASLHFS